VAPADDKKNARLIIAQIIINTFNSLQMAYPEVTPKRRVQRQQISAGVCESTVSKLLSRSCFKSKWNPFIYPTVGTVAIIAAGTSVKTGFR